MKVEINLKDTETALKKIEKAELLLRELRQIITWELPQYMELEIKEPSVSADDPTDK